MALGPQPVSASSKRRPSGPSGAPPARPHSARSSPFVLAWPPRTVCGELGGQKLAQFTSKLASQGARPWRWEAAFLCRGEKAKVREERAKWAPKGQPVELRGRPLARRSMGPVTGARVWPISAQFGPATEAPLALLPSSLATRRANRQALLARLIRQLLVGPFFLVGGQSKRLERARQTQAQTELQLSSARLKLVQLSSAQCEFSSDKVQSKFSAVQGSSFVLVNIVGRATALGQTRRQLGHLFPSNWDHCTHCLEAPLWRACHWRACQPRAAPTRPTVQQWAGELRACKCDQLTLGQAELN